MEAETAATPENPIQHSSTVTVANVPHDSTSNPLPVRRSEGSGKNWTILKQASIGQSKSGLQPLFENRVLTVDVGDGSDQSPESCASALRLPRTLQSFSRLRRRLSTCTPAWIARYLDAHGLEILFESFDELCKKRITNISQVFIQLECVGCIRAIMNSQTGLDYIIENRDFTRKLATGIEMFLSFFYNSSSKF